MDGILAQERALGRACGFTWGDLQLMPTSERLRHLRGLKEEREAEEAAAAVADMGLPGRGGRDLRG